MLTMTAEIHWLILTLMMTTLMWVPPITRLLFQMGTIAAVYEPTGVHPYEDDWPRRATRAHYNAIENLAVYAPMVLLLVLMGLNDGMTAIAAAVFFFARLVHYVVYVFAVPVVRTAAFLVGFGAQLVIALRLLEAI